MKQNDTLPLGVREVFAPESAPAVLETLMRDAEKRRVSDVHIQCSGGGADVAFRLDGVLKNYCRWPSPLGERVAGRIKFLARLKTYQDSMPQENRIDSADLGLSSDVRVSTYPAVVGEKIVLRLFSSQRAATLEELRLEAGLVHALKHFLNTGAGLLLLTGPAGSGKTTTIYACLRQLGEYGGRHVVTIEDPVEQIIPGIMQTEICEPRGITFASAAKHLLRQDPQTIVIGEIRDEETAGIAVRAALTGHQVIATLHAGSCDAVLDRLQTLCADRPALLASLSMVINQRLARRVCQECRGKGCADCLETGFRGRLPIAEWIRLDDATRRRLRAAEFLEIKPARFLGESASAWIAAGETTREECRRVLGDLFGISEVAGTTANL
jgi:general secretion pathway protein E